MSLNFLKRVCRSFAGFFAGNERGNIVGSAIGVAVVVTTGVVAVAVGVQMQRQVEESFSASHALSLCQVQNPITLEGQISSDALNLFLADAQSRLQSAAGYLTGVSYPVSVCLVFEEIVGGVGSLDSFQCEGDGDVSVMSTFLSTDLAGQQFDAVADITVLGRAAFAATVGDQAGFCLKVPSIDPPPDPPLPPPPPPPPPPPTPVPTVQPTEEPTTSPGPEPTSGYTPAPTAQPTETAPQVSTPDPDPEPTGGPDLTPTVQATATPATPDSTPEPQVEPTVEPYVNPTISWFGCDHGSKNYFCPGVLV